MTRRQLQLLAVAAPVAALVLHLVRRLLIVAGISLLAFSPPNHEKTARPLTPAIWPDAHPAALPPHLGRMESGRKPPPTMKTLSLTQPYATLIALGYKKIETRGGRVNYRGPLLIHASATRAPWARAACAEPVIAKILAEHGLTYDNLPRGLILCSCELREVAKMVLEPSPPPKKKPKKPRPEIVISEVSSLEQALGGWAPGRFAWQLGEVQLLQQPVPAKGQLSLWDATGALQVFAAEHGLRARLAGNGPLFEPAGLVQPTDEQMLLFDAANQQLAKLSYTTLLPKPIK